MTRNNFAKTEAGARDRAPSGAETLNIKNRSVAELEAENAALRRALADAGGEARLAAIRHELDLPREKAGRATEAAEAEAHHGREMAANRNDLAASQESNAALRRANLALTESRAALRESQERLRLILDSTADYVIFSMDTERRVASWNAGAKRLLGWSEEEILGRSADVIFTPEDREAGAPEEEGDGALRHGRAADERWHQRRDGSRFWANGLMLPLRDPEAGPAAPPLGLLKVMRDETGRRRAEEALREGEARWRGLFERMQEGFALCEMVYDADGQAVDYRHLELNAAWGRLTGVPNEAVQGRLVSEAIPGIEPFWLETYARVVETGEPAHFEYCLAVYGRWFEVMAYRTEPGRFAAVFLNVTERKAAEARRDALVELGDRLRDLRDPGEIARTVAEVIGRALGASRAGYGDLDAAQESLRVAGDWTDGRVESFTGEHRPFDYWAGFADDLRRGGAVAVEDVGRDPRTAGRADAFLAAGVRSLVNVPVVEGGRVAAILYLQDAAPRRWSAEEVAFVRGAAERAWAAAERARAEEGLRAANEALRAEEARLRLALEAGRLGTWELDVATDAATRSRRHDAIFGYGEPPSPEWGFEPFMLHVLPEDRARVERSFRAALENAEDWHLECRIRRVDGTERWIEARGQPIRDAEGRTTRLLGVVADVTERKRAEERRALLVAELNHRVKNTLAVVQSLAAQTARGAADLPSFSTAFQARLIALARAHDLLTRENWEGAALADVVRAALEPGGEARVELDVGGGPDAPLLMPSQALALALALHELGTNALKHGALSAPGGRVSVRCAADRKDGAWMVEWLERGGPPIAGPPTRRGFGLRLLERGLTAQAGMAADLRFEPEGLRCALRLPLVP